MLAHNRVAPHTSADVQGAEGDLAWRLDLPNRYPNRVSTASREEADDYGNIVCRLNPHWRVIVCRDHLQWILQHQRGQKEGAPTWRSRSFCPSRIEIVRCVREHCGLVDAAALGVLYALPAHIREAVRQ